MKELNNKGVKSWIGYADDTFNKNRKMFKIFFYKNKLHNSIIFTLEFEENITFRF